MAYNNMTTPEEDQAIAETIADGQTMDQTDMNNTTINASMRPPLAQVFDKSSQPVVAAAAAIAAPTDLERKNFTNGDETLPDLSISVNEGDKPTTNTLYKKTDIVEDGESTLEGTETSWNLTRPDQKCYEQNQTGNTFMNQNATDVTLIEDVGAHDSIYKTVNEGLDDEQQQEGDAEQAKQPSSDTVIIKNCLVAFMHTSEDFFIQMENFDDRYAIIKPQIDDCLDPFDLNESKLCVTQYKEVCLSLSIFDYYLL